MPDVALEARAMNLVDLFLKVPRIPALSDGRERKLVLLALGLGADGGRALHAELDEGVDFDRVFDIALRFGVFPTVAGRVLAELGPRLPAATAERGRELLERYTLQNQILLADLARIAPLLAEEGVPYAVLKGAVLLARFPAARLRHVDDIDLLVPPDALAATERALTRAGFRPDLAEYNEARHPLCMVTAAGTKCEVHTGLEALDAAEVLARADTVAVGRGAVRVATLAHLARHLCHHVVVQHAEDPRFVPRHLLDLELLLAADPELAADRDPNVVASMRLLSLARGASGRDLSADLLARLLFPTHHSSAPVGVPKRLQRGLGGLDLRRALRKMVFPVS